MAVLDSSIELPDYIHQRHAQVTSAGLTMLRMKVSDSELSTAVEGTPEQFLRSGFITDEQRFEKFVSQKSKTASGAFKFLEIFTPDEHGYPSMSRRDGGIFRIVITGEALPQEAKTISPEIQMYRFVIPSNKYGKEEVVTYAAKSIEVLIDAGVAPVDAMGKYWGHAVDIYGMEDGSGPDMWRKQEKFGMVFFRSYVTAQEAAKKKNDDASKSNYDSPESYKKDVLSALGMASSMIDAMFSVYLGTHSKNGFVYSLPHEVVERINSHMDGIYAAVSSCTPTARRDGGFKLIAGGKQ